MYVVSLQKNEDAVEEIEVPGRSLIWCLLFIQIIFVDDVLTLDELVQFVKELVVLDEEKKNKPKYSKKTSLAPGMGSSSERSSISTVSTSGLYTLSIHYMKQFYQTYDQLKMSVVHI